MKNFINRALVAKKHLKLFFALFAMLALGVGNAWGAEKTITLTYSDFGLTTSYVQKTATVDGIGFTVNQGYKGSGNVIQMNSTKGSGILYNTTSIAGLKSITVNVSSGSKTYTITSGTMQTPSGNSQTGTATKTFSIPSGDTYFQLKVSGASYFSSIVITYDDSNSGGETPGTGGETPDPGNGTTGTLVITRASFPSGSLAYNTTDNWSATASTGETVSGQGDLYSTSNQTTMQTKNSSVSTHYHNTTAMPGAISKISVEVASGTDRSYTVYASTTAITSTTGLTSLGSLTGATPIEIDPTKDYKYFWLQCTGGASYLNNITITYNIESFGGDEPETPATDLTDAQFAWSAATAEATMGATNTFPTLTNTVPVSVTYESSTPATATIAADGTITLVAPGTTTISAKFAGGEVSGTTYAPKTVTYALTVLKAHATPTSTVYVKVTSTAGITDGEYLIVYEDAEGNPKAPVAFDGSLAPVKLDVASNNIEVSIASNTIAGNTDIDAATFTINTAAGTIQTKDGYYIGQTSNANGLATSTTTEYTNTISIENDGSATIISSGGAYLRYNSANDNLRFRYFKSSTYTAQKAIALYKKTNGQQLAGLAYATTKYLTKLGDAFTTPTLTNPNFLTVTYSSSDNNVATVDNTGTVTIKAAGVVVITAAFAGDASYLEASAKYTLCVTEHAGTEVDPYSVADARRVIDVMETAEGVYATGIVSEIVTAYNSEHGNITYNISIDGTTVADQLQAYRGKGVNGEKFSSANDIKVGDEVVVKGNLTKYNTTYEFDADNQLVSLKRDKQQAGLAYEEKEHTANVGEDFTEPTLTNPNSLTVTYSSSNTALATVNATTGEVSILAAGKVTITASSAADATYAAGSASYNITITNPGLAVATLPFAFNENKATIETTAGMTQNGLGSDYSASTAPNSQLKFDGTGDWVVIRFDSEPEKLSYDIKNNSFSGGKFSVQESADGETYTDVAVHTTITDLQSEEYELNSVSRYVKFIYTTKSSGNVGLGNISITKADHRQEAGLAWNPATVSLTVGDAFTAPTFSNPNGLTGITFTSDNTALATVNNAGAITLVSGKTGTATITATFADGHATYKPAEATCVITVSPKSDKVVILAQYNGQWYAMMAQYVSGKTSHLAALPVTYVGGKLYNVADADKTLIEWERAVVDGKATFSNNSKYLTGKSDKTDLTLAATACEWTIDGDSYLIGARTFLYNAENNWFRNFGTSNAGNKNYSGMPTVTAPVYVTGQAYGRSVNLGTDGYRYGTICLPFGSTNFTGAEFFECVGKEDGKVYLGSVSTLVAGTPYIFLASADEVAVYGDGTTAATAGNSNGLHGTFANDTEVAVGNYILLNNELCQAEAICYVNANRAYLVMSEVPTGVPTQMPGRRYIGMGVQGENAETGFENIVAPEGETKKVFIDGQIIIIRNGEKFNIQGQRL